MCSQHRLRKTTKCLNVISKNVRMTTIHKNPSGKKSIGEDVDKSEPLCTVSGTIKG